MDKAAKGIIAIDYGRKRVGIAGCQAEISIAFGITTLVIQGLNDLLKQLEPILEERSVSEIVIGFPITLGDKPGTLKDDVLKFRERLTDEGYIVHLVDEALSSVKAAGKLQQRGRRAKKGDFDRTAAAIILQEYLDGYLPPLSEEEINQG